MKKNNTNAVQVLNSVREAIELYKKLGKQKNARDKDVSRLRNLLVSTPDLWPLATKAVPFIRQTLIEKMSHGATRAAMLAEGNILMKQLGFDTAPPLERLLIDHIVTARLRLIHAEHEYNTRVVNQSISFKTGEYWDNLLSSTQARFLRAVESLARVRRLARNTPALQINIANEGGKQINLQGNESGQKTTS